MAFNPNSTNTGVYAPTTNVWDVSNVESANIQEPGLKELLVRLYQNLNILALVTNNKESGYYHTLEQVNSQLFFPNPALSSQTPANAVFRQVYRVVVNVGALPNTTTLSVPHNIAVNPAFTFTRIYGCASNPTTLSFLPLPYVSATTANIIELSVTATNVVIKTGSNRSGYTTCYVILEYLRF